MPDEEQRGPLTLPVDTQPTPPTSAPIVIDPNICHTVMESLPDGIILVDRARQIVAANIATEEIFGYAREEMISKSVDMLVPDKFRQGHSGQVPPGPQQTLC